MRKQSYSNQVIWIIGASSGIGHALASELAARGAILALSARRKIYLDALKESLGNQHKTFVLDITDAELVARTAQAIRASFGRIDRIVFLAAAYTPMTIDKLDLTVARYMVDVNLLGGLHVIQAALPIFKEQQHGQLALCGSVAGYTGLPASQPYSATKAAIMNLAESLRAELPNIIDIKLISPGFVQSELTDKNHFKMPMIISAPCAACYIADGLQTRAFEVHFPKRFTILLKILRLLPYCIVFRITKKFNL